MAEGERQLLGAGIREAALEAAWLVAHVTGLPRLELFLHGDRPMSGTETARWQALLSGRVRRRPLQHLLGTVGFLGLDLETGPEALIPRPETEQLVLSALRAWNAATSGWAAPRPGWGDWLDFGTGSGCIALALAAAVGAGVGWRREIRVHGLDISSRALALARRNAGRPGMSARVFWHEGDGFGALERSGLGGIRFGLIVANPPYIPTGDIPALDVEVREHDPLEALDGGPDGMRFYRLLAREAGRWLAPGGVLAVEFGDGQADALVRLFAGGAGWCPGRVEKDLSGRERVLIVRSIDPGK